MSNHFLIACHECDLLYRLKPMPEGVKAVCSRCGALLYSHKKNSLDRTLSLVIAGLILFFVSNMFPLLGMKDGSLVMETTLMQCVTTMYNRDMQGLSALVFITCCSCRSFSFSGCSI